MVRYSSYIPISDLAKHRTVIALALTAVVQGKNLTFYHRRINHDSTALTM